MCVEPPTQVGPERFLKVRTDLESTGAEAEVHYEDLIAAEAQKEEVKKETE